MCHPIRKGCTKTQQRTGIIISMGKHHDEGIYSELSRLKNLLEIPEIGPLLEISLVAKSSFGISGSKPNLGTIKLKNVLGIRKPAI